MSNPTFFGILNTQTLAYAGFLILGIFLLVLIIWGIINISSGGELLTLALTAVTGAIVLILAYFIIYNIALASTNNIEENASLVELMQEQPQVPLLTEIDNPSVLILPEISPIAQITNLRICYNDNLPCIIEGFTEPDIYVYWEVEGGVGCCNTFNCDYQAFTAFCGSPFQEYNLYDIALDDEVYQWGEITEWDYECSYNTPWNYFNYVDIAPGEHKITIWQKNCREIVDTITIYFSLTLLGDGTYVLEQI